jgi:integrase
MGGAGSKQNAILTERIIRGLSEPGIYWDGRVPGFGLRVYPTGSKSWVLVYREWDAGGRTIRGKKVKRTIGGWPGIGVDAAVEIARDWHVGILLRERRWELRGSVGGDSPTGSQPQSPSPSDSKQGAIPTIGRLADEYQSRYLPRNAGRRHSHDCALRIRSKIIPTIGESTPIESITRRMIRDAHSAWAETHTPTEANRCLSILRKMFFCAIDWGMLSDGRGNPAAGIEMYRERRRERHLSVDEIGRLLVAADSESTEDHAWLGAAIRLYLLTGLRKMELLSRRWADYDSANRVLRLQTTKAGRPFCLPLSSVAAEILDGLRRAAIKSGNKDLRNHAYIFPASMYVDGARRKVIVPGRHVADFPRRAWDRVRVAAGLEDVSIHVLRHTAASILAAGGVSLKLIGGLLNQSTASITDRYAHLQAEAIRGTAEVLAGVLEGINSEGKKTI